MWKINNMFPSTIIDNSHKYKTADYSKFKICKNTLFSSVMPYQFSQIRNILSLHVPHSGIAADLCSHIGCSAVNIAHAFPKMKIECVEIEKKVFDKLCGNISRFSLDSSITPHCTNAIDFLAMSKQRRFSFINIDPPWGGPKYKKNHSMMLSLSKDNVSYTIYDMINMIFDFGISPIVTFKAPTNFDIATYEEKVSGYVQYYHIYNKPRDVGSRPQKISYIYIITRV